MPSSRKARAAILSLIPDDQWVVHEFGSGWGHLAFPLAKRRPALSVCAIEGSLLPWLCSVGVQKILRCPNLTIRRKNFYSVSLEKTDCVICYLYPGAMRRLKSKFAKELKPGAFVITHTFSIPGWKPEKMVTIQDLWKSQVYLYRVP